MLLHVVISSLSRREATSAGQVLQRRRNPDGGFTYQLRLYDWDQASCMGRPAKRRRPSHATDPAPCADLPHDLVRRVAECLALPHLIQAAPTSRLFQEALGERQRASINRCLEAAAACHGSDMVAEIRRMSSDVHQGLHPTTGQPLPRDLLQPVTGVDLARGPHGGLTVTEWHAGPPPSAPASLSCDFGWLNSRHFLNVSGIVGVDLLDGVYFRSVNYHFEHEQVVHVSAEKGKVHEALGLFLAVVGVHAQVLVRPPGESLNSRISPARWIEGGALIFTVHLAREGVLREHVDARGHLRPDARLQVWQRALQAQGAADIVGVASALGLTCFICVELQGDRCEGVFLMLPGQGLASAAELRARLLHE